MTRREVGDLEQVRGPAGNEQVFPFGRPSTPRGPRTPSGQAGLFVLGVYPSALHVRWEPPAWARRDLGISAVAALAVDDEPSVFWDGADAVDRVSEWRADVGFLEGDEEGRWGRVRPAGNGTSGRSVVEGVLSPLGIESESTWFSDAVDLFFIKRAGGGRQRQQADAIAEDYEPFARATGLPSASLPLRPTVADLVDLAVSGHRERLRTELVRSRSPLVVTLGEEVERARAYLEILQIRMGPRLQLQIEVPRHLLAMPFPTMMLQTLVENAIKHGLEPRTAGGTVWILARETEGRVAVTVADDGQGFGGSNSSGTGIGLQNVRERLRLAYGSEASLSVVANFPNGVAATITVPTAAGQA